MIINLRKCSFCYSKSFPEITQIQIYWIIIQINRSLTMLLLMSNDCILFNSIIIALISSKIDWINIGKKGKKISDRTFVCLFPQLWNSLVIFFFLQHICFCKTEVLILFALLLFRLLLIFYLNICFANLEKRAHKFNLHMKKL